MKTNGDDPASAYFFRGRGVSEISYGMTKREAFAMNPPAHLFDLYTQPSDPKKGVIDAANLAVKWADALIAALNAREEG